MPVLVGDDVGLGERAALGAEPGAQLVVEREVDVDGLIGRAIEGADRGRRAPAAGRGLAGEEARRRFAVAARWLAPVLLPRVDDADDPAVLALVGVGARPARRRQLGDG